MKKSTFIAITISLLSIFLFIQISMTSKESKSISTDPQLVNELDMNASLYEVDSYEGDEDLSYSYIVNPECLSQFDFLAEGITHFGDNISNYLKSMGITSSKLTITDCYMKGSVIITTLIIEANGNPLIVKYDNLTNEFFYE